MATGKEIWDGLTEYPLPAISGVRDYIFYLVPASDGYGSGARYFFKKFYKKHVAHEVNSLEKMIDRLHADVTDGVAQIREIVIVAHGTPQGLEAKVMESASNTNLPEYRHLTAKSLSHLQYAFRDGKFPTFKDRRAVVVERLLDDSWVTIRACRVGVSAACMYAYYSFFGGRANVYAPTEYQFFGSQSIMPGMRVETRLGVHAHQVKQHFLPNDDHTPDRKDAIVRAIIDPAKFSEPVELASTSVAAPEAPYEALIDALNAQKATAAVKSAFDAAGEPLTRPSVKRKRRDTEWVITDKVNHPEGPFLVEPGGLLTVEHSVYEEISGVGSDRVAALMTAASIPKAFSARQAFPLQLFFHQQHNDWLKGRRFTLAAYVDAAGADPAAKQAYDAIVELLDGNRYSDGTIDLATIFKDELDADLAATPRITRTSATNAKYKTWSIRGGASFEVKEERQVSNDAELAQVLSVYDLLSSDARKSAQQEVISQFGADPDTPGTELPAYLDRFSLDDLIGFVDYLREPYRSENCFYIRHAQGAIERKRENLARTLDRIAANPNDPFDLDPYTHLRLVESEDLDVVAYDFNFNSYWNEVRESILSPYAFQRDLFDEEELWPRVRKWLVLPDLAELDEIEADSPAAELEALRLIEARDLDRFFTSDKDILDTPPADADLSCDEFKTLIEKWKSFQGLPPEEIQRQLDAILAADGKSFLDHAWHYIELFHKIGLPFEFLEIVELGKSIPVFIAQRLPFIAHTGATMIFLEGILPPLIGIFLWLEFTSAQQEAVEESVAKGKLLAVRQWLWELEFMASQGPVPDAPSIDLGEDFLPRYRMEQGYSAYPSYGFETTMLTDFVMHPEDFQEGFDEGKEQMERVGAEIVRKVDEASAEVIAGLGLDACKLQVLKDAGILDVAAIRSKAVAALASALLQKLPTL